MSLVALPPVRRQAAVVRQSFLDDPQKVAELRLQVIDNVVDAFQKKIPNTHAYHYASKSFVADTIKEAIWDGRVSIRGLKRIMRGDALCSMEIFLSNLSRWQQQKYPPPMVGLE